MRKDVVIVEGSLEVKLRQNGQMKSRDGKSQRREEKRRTKKIKEEKVRRKKIQVREKVGKSRNTIFFQWFVAPEGRKVGLLKRRVRSHLGRWEMTNCTPLWREAHLEVKLYKAPQLRSTFGSCDVEQNARRCGAKHISKSKCTKDRSFGALLEVEMSKKRTPLWREARFQVKICKTSQCRTTFESGHVNKVDAVVARSTFRSQKCKQLKGTEHFRTFRCRFAWQAQGIVHLVKRWAKCEGFAACSKTMAGVGHLKRMCKDAFRVAGAVQETRSSEMFGVRRSGRWFPERGCILEHQIFRFPKMILRDRCSTSYDLASLFRGRHNTLDRWNGKIAKRIGGRQLCTQLFILEGGLAELLRFWCCQLRKRRKSRRIASFLTLSSSRIEEISQNCCVFKLADRQVDR